MHANLWVPKSSAWQLVTTCLFFRIAYFGRFFGVVWWITSHTQRWDISFFARVRTSIFTVAYISCSLHGHEFGKIWCIHERECEILRFKTENHAFLGTIICSVCFSSYWAHLLMSFGYDGACIPKNVPSKSHINILCCLVAVGISYWVSKKWSFKLSIYPKILMLTQSLK